MTDEDEKKGGVVQEKQGFGVMGGQVSKRPNILKKAPPNGQCVTIQLDKTLPLTTSNAKKAHSTTTARSPVIQSSSDSEMSSSSCSNSKKTPTTMIAGPTPPSQQSLQPTPSPTFDVMPKSFSKPKKTPSTKFARPAPPSQPATLPTASPTFAVAPSTSSSIHPSARSLKPTPSPKLTTPAKFTPPLRAPSSRAKKPRADTFDPSPVPAEVSPLISSDAKTPKPSPAPPKLTNSAPPLLITPTKFTHPLRPQSSRVKKPRAESFDLRTVPRQKRTSLSKQK